MIPIIRYNDKTEDGTAPVADVTTKTAMTSHELQIQLDCLQTNNDVDILRALVTIRKAIALSFDIQKESGKLKSYKFGEYDSLDEIYDVILNVFTGCQTQCKVVGVIKQYNISSNNNPMPATTLKILVEAFWILADICSGTWEHVECVVNTGIIPIATEVMLSSDESRLFNECLRLLTNVLEDDSGTDFVKVTGRMLAKVSTMLQQSRSCAVESCLEADCNRCQITNKTQALVFNFYPTLFFEPIPMGDQLLLKHIFVTVSHMIPEVVQKDMLPEFLHIFTSASQQGWSALLLESLIDSGHLHSLIHLVLSNDDQIRLRVMYVVLNLHTVASDSNKEIIGSSFLNHFPQLMCLMEHHEISQAMEFLCNIAESNSQAIIERLFDFDLLPYVVGVLVSTEDDTLIRDGLNVVVKLMHKASHERKVQLIINGDYGLITAVIPLASYFLEKDFNDNKFDTEVRLMLNIFKELFCCIRKFITTFTYKTSPDVSALRSVLKLFRAELSKDIFTRTIDDEPEFFSEGRKIFLVIDSAAKTTEAGLSRINDWLQTYTELCECKMTSEQV